MYLNNKLKKSIALLCEDMNAKVKVVQRKEYPTLLIDGKVIVQGEIEVKERINVLLRERALEYYLND